MLLFSHQEQQTRCNSSNQTNLRGCLASGKSNYLGGLDTLVIENTAHDQLRLTWLYIANNINIPDLD